MKDIKFCNSRDENESLQGINISKIGDTVN